MTDRQVALVFKICAMDEWATACRAGSYAGSPADARDGFIHFSAAHQLAGTAEKHFRGQAGLLLVAIDAARLGPALRWEPSRGGDLFPHLYGRLDPAAAVWTRALALDANGVPIIPEGAVQC